MPCVALDLGPLPTLPAPLTIEPPELPSITVGAEFCCKLPEFTLSIPIPIPPLTLNPAVILLINTALQTIDAYLDLLFLDCPLE